MTLILRPYENKVLMPVPKWEWREPSRAMPKDQFGRQDQVRFSITARLHDGYVCWKGWFDDRDDADAFFYALMRHQIIGDPMPRELWELPTPAWHPGLDIDVGYSFATVTFLTTGAGSNQTYTSPSDWNNSSNKIETIGAGGGGASAGSSSSWFALNGGTGGAYNTITNFTFASPGSTTATYRPGQGVNPSAGTGDQTGGVGGDSWFNGTTLAGSSVGSKGGQGGTGDATSAPALTGGSASGGVGSGFDGGGSGSATGNIAGSTFTSQSGGGGAAGPNANGVASSNVTEAPPPGAVSNGGRGDGTSGGIGGTGTNTATGGAGAAGTEWDATHGSGGGGGASGVSSGDTTGGAAGNYGAGGGAAGSNSSSTGGASAQGIVVVTYTPPSLTSVFAINLAMMGM